MKPIKYEDAGSLNSWTNTIKQLNEEFDICFFGHSICEFHEWQKDFPTQKVINLGYAGSDLNTMLRRKEQISIVNPKEVFLLIGTNSLNYKNKDFSKKYSELLKYIQGIQRCERVTIINIPPNNSRLHQRKRNRQIAEKNAIIKDLSHTYNCRYIDIYSILANENGKYIGAMSKDGTHPSEEGYNLILNAIKGE